MDVLVRLCAVVYCIHIVRSRRNLITGNRSNIILRNGAVSYLKAYSWIKFWDRNKIYRLDSKSNGQIDFCKAYKFIDRERMGMNVCLCGFAFACTTFLCL